MCPNCRQDADLEAPVDVETETWEAILRTTDPRTPMADAGTTQDPHVQMLNFKPFPDLSPPSPSHQENNLTSDMQSLSIDNNDESTHNPTTNPDRELTLTRTLSPGLSLAPIIETDVVYQPTRDASGLATPPVAIPRRVRALSATRDGFDALASLSTTPTIDRGPYVYGDMTVNADGSAEATTSEGNVVQLPRESLSDDVTTPQVTKTC